MLAILRQIYQSTPKWLVIAWGFLAVILGGLFEDRLFGSLNHWIDQAVGDPMKPLAIFLSSAIFWIFWMAALGICMASIWWAGQKDGIRRAGGDTPRSEDPRTSFLAQRRKMEEACIGAEGAPVTALLSANISQVEIEIGDAPHRVAISRSGGDDVWIYDHGPSITKIFKTPENAKRGDLIDVRLLRASRGTLHCRIGDRVMLMTATGHAVQLLLTGVLNYEAGDDIDEARFKYAVYDAGTFLIPAL